MGRARVRQQSELHDAVVPRVVRRVGADLPQRPHRPEESHTEARNPAVWACLLASAALFAACVGGTRAFARGPARSRARARATARSRSRSSRTAR